ncbi:MAG: hypothetical protein PHS44_03025 [Candidatus Dojkabacteria bacterium]|jgi:hypothetical protein|nr:hypothetical protein [Candidatus Dojkabacteria bacterium]
MEERVVASVQGINQSGKTTVVELLHKLLGGAHNKLPFYETPFGKYILNYYLPAKESRNPRLKESVIAQMALFAANRLEVVAIFNQLETERLLTPGMPLISDRSPYSSFFTFLDALMDAAERNELHEFVRRGEIGFKEAQAITYLMRRWDEKDDIYDREIVFDEGEVRALRCLYHRAVQIIEGLEGYYLDEFLGKNRVEVYLDIPAYVAYLLREEVEAGGKSLDAQEGLRMQRFAREMFLFLCAEGKAIRFQQYHAEAILVVRMRPEEIAADLAEILCPGYVAMEKPARVSSSTHFRIVDPRDVPELQVAWEVIDDVLPRGLQAELLAELRRGPEGQPLESPEAF